MHLLSTRLISSEYWRKLMWQLHVKFFGHFLPAALSNHTRRRFISIYAVSLCGMCGTSTFSETWGKTKLYIDGVWRRDCRLYSVVTWYVYESKCGTKPCGYPSKIIRGKSAIGCDIIAILALYKFPFYLVTYLLTYFQCIFLSLL